jgi:hypothetical protein
MLAIRILSRQWSENYEQHTEKSLSLLRIVRGISENARIKSASYAITALNDDAVFIGIKKFIIKENSPLSMSKFAVTVGHKFPFQLFCAGILGCKVFERVW